MYKKYLKRSMDFVLSLAAMPFVLLSIIVLAPIIYINDRGPIFYNASRFGLCGSKFTMYKFRSMYVNSPNLVNEDGSTYSSSNDSRLTTVGRIMRKMSLDEIPQIINVLKGDMSFIGPRPTLASKDFCEIPEENRKRYQVRPGITGYAQAYFRNSINKDEKYKWDNYYVDHVSFALDIKILIRTIRSVFRQENIFDAEQVTLIEKDEKNSALCKRNNGSKRLLIIGASILQLPAIHKAKEMGLYVGVLDYNKQAAGVKIADEFYEVSTIDEEGAYLAAKEFRADGIITLATDMPMRSVAYATQKLGLIGISYDTAIKATDKGEMIKAFEFANVEHPWYFILSKPSDLESVINQVEYPCISKPVDNAGSRGVMLVKCKDDLDHAVKYSSTNGRKGGVIIEEYMQGSEVSVEVMVVDGVINILQITDKLTTKEPHFVEMGHSQPSQLTTNEINQIEDLTVRAVKSVNVINGPVHVEIMMTKKGPKMIELGARMGGDCITTHLLPLSTGIDMVKATIDVALGNKPDIQRKLAKGSAIRYIGGYYGTIQEIKGIDTAKRMPGIQQVTLIKNVGETVGEICSSVDRIGYVISQAENSEEAVNCCERAIKRITIITN